MGLSGGGSSRSGSAQKWATPLAKNAAGTVQNVFSNEQPYIERTASAVKSTIPTLTENFNSWQPITAQSRGYYGDVLGGKYLDPSNNPGLSSILERTRRDVTGGVNSQFAGAGRYGSAAHTDVLSRNLAESEGAILADQYNRERAMMDAAAAAGPQAQAQSLAELLQSAGVSVELPFAGTNALSNSLAALFSGGTQKGPGIGGQLIGAIGQVGAGAAQAGAFSDRRLKENIEKVGEFDDGLGIYHWNYTFDPETRHEGVMADEIEKFRPWALGPTICGFKTVRYDLI